MGGAPIPVGLIGAGKHGERYLRHLRADVPELRVALLCRRDPKAGRDQAEQAGARYVADFRELAVSPEIEAVIGVVPPALHLEIARLAAGAGKALLLEKPLATRVADAREIERAAAEAGVPAMVAQTLRFNSVVRTVAASLERIGPVHQVCLSQRFEPSSLDWLDDPERAGGGIVLHTGVHSFDLLRFFTGYDPVAVSAEITRAVTRRTEDNFAAVFSFPAPLLATVAGSRSSGARNGAIEISGLRAQIVADHVHGRVTLLEPGRATPLPVPGEAPTVRETLRAFARVLRENAPPPITLEDGVWAVAMAEACYRSAESGRAEPVTVR